MMVALTIGAIVVASVYTIGASSARHFQEQQRVSQLQLAVRLALDRIRRDAARAAYHGTMNSTLDVACGVAPPPIRGVFVTDRSPTTTAALSTMSGWTPTSSHGDRLEITGNFRTNDSFVVREWYLNTLRLQTQWLSYRRTFAADPATNDIDTALFAQTFSPGTSLMVQFPGRTRVWTTVSSASADVLGTDARILTANANPCPPSAVPGVEGWAQGGVRVAPVTTVRYEIVPAPAALAPRVAQATGANTVLMRTEVNPVTGAVVGAPVPVLEYAVHFDVDVFSDVAPLGPLPSRVQVFDDAAAATQTLNAPQRVRGLRISLAARTPESDPQIGTDVPPLADGTPRVFRVFAERATGGARVRSAYTEVFLPNSATN